MASYNLLKLWEKMKKDAGKARNDKTKPSSSVFTKFLGEGFEAKISGIEKQIDSTKPNFKKIETDLKTLKTMMAKYMKLLVDADEDKFANDVKAFIKALDNLSIAVDQQGMGAYDSGTKEHEFATFTPKARAAFVKFAKFSQIMELMGRRMDELQNVLDNNPPTEQTALTKLEGKINKLTDEYQKIGDASAKEREVLEDFTEKAGL